jgi:hypothetical protein
MLFFFQALDIIPVTLIRKASYTVDKELVLLFVADKMQNL